MGEFLSWYHQKFLYKFERSVELCLRLSLLESISWNFLLKMKNNCPKGKSAEEYFEDKGRMRKTKITKNVWMPISLRQICKNLYKTDLLVTSGLEPPFFHLFLSFFLFFLFEFWNCHTIWVSVFCMHAWAWASKNVHKPARSWP